MIYTNRPIIAPIKSTGRLALVIIRRPRKGV